MMTLNRTAFTYRVTHVTKKR